MTAALLEVREAMSQAPPKELSWTNLAFLIGFWAAVALFAMGLVISGFSNVQGGLGSAPVLGILVLWGTLCLVGHAVCQGR